jgi:hypothetical protein
MYMITVNDTDYYFHGDQGVNMFVRENLCADVVCVGWLFQVSKEPYTPR